MPAAWVWVALSRVIAWAGWCSIQHGSALCGEVTLSTNLGSSASFLSLCIRLCVVPAADRPILCHISPVVRRGLSGHQVESRTKRVVAPPDPRAVNTQARGDLFTPRIQIRERGGGKCGAADRVTEAPSGSKISTPPTRDGLSHVRWAFIIFG